MSKKPVVIYGANGFSGRLIAEFLREYNPPFIAAGRSAARIKDVMDHVPGIETADFEIVETAGSLEDLVRLFEGAKVVCNTAGPFIYNGPRVIEAALKSGCHYIDIGGEQAWIRELPAEISRIAVVVNPPLDEALQLLEMDIFDGLQLHGEESREFCELLTKNRKPVLKAFRISEKEGSWHPEELQIHS